MSELPQGWEIKKLSEIASTGLISDGDWVESKDQDPSGAIRLIQLADIGDGNFKDKSSRFMNKEKAALLRCTFLQTGDVLIARMPDPLGRACLFPELRNDCVTVVDICIVRLTPDDLMENRLLKYWLNSPAIRNLIDMQATGTTRRRITKKKLSAFELPVPPRVEQKRIADKLDSVLAKVEAAQARLDKIPAISKRFRQSVLAAATSGELTKDWREEHHEAFKKVTLGNAGVIVKTGPFGSALHKSEYIMSGIPVVNPTHISEGKIFSSESMTITHDKFEDLKAWNLKIGDVIVGRRGEMGRAAEIKEEHLPMLCGTGSMIIRTEESGISPAFLTIALRSPTAIQFFESNSVGSTMVNLNQKIIKAFEIYYPSDEEQSEIVSRVNQLFEHANTVEKQYNAAKARLDKLTQSILAKAFKGELLSNSVDSKIKSIESSIETLNA
ncbi:restriction endonuclease subunit S [Alteromonas abrolhosensis]|uniref:restriction endonuclease subunit S n=1 Tax=Alteromonas abrolhosensis TaxID=1892904 RepID=UPI00096BA5CA|nr:restriction endonuclease subunit S [Alteromonas abrolhosensis]